MLAIVTPTSPHYASRGRVEIERLPGEAPQMRLLRSRCSTPRGTPTKTGAPQEHGCRLLRSFVEWRDPDSDRGHHDFQWRALCSPSFLVVHNYPQTSQILTKAVPRCSPLSVAGWC